MEEKKTKVASIEEAEKWTVGNEHIYSGYRVNVNSFRDGIKSCFTKSNEFMNIWTHLIGALIFVLLIFFIFRYYHISVSTYNKLQKEFHQSDFLKELLSHSNSVTEYLENIKTEKSPKTIQDFISGLKSNYLLKYEEIKKNLIDEHEIVDRKIHLKLEKINEIIEENFEKVLLKLKELAKKSNLSFEKWNTKIIKILNVDLILKSTNNIFKETLDNHAIIVNVFGTIICFAFSAMFHSFYVINPRINKILQKLDYVGIIVALFGAFYAFFYYNFYCFPFWRNFYSIVLGINCLVVFGVMLTEYVDTPEGQKFKSLLMVGLGCSNLISIAHTLVLNWSPKYGKYILLGKDIAGIAISGGIFLIGVVIYVSHFPERYYPKKFDIWLNSHTIWHIFVFLGFVSYYITVLHMYDVRLGMSCE